MPLDSAVLSEENRRRMSTNGYAVCEVEFEEGTVNSILCSSWLIRPKKYDETSQTYCFWPCKKELASILAKYGCPPDKDFWIRYKCKILFEYSDYESAKIKLKCMKEFSCDRKTKMVIADGAKREEEKKDETNQISETLSKLNLILEKQFDTIRYTNHMIGEIINQNKTPLDKRSTGDHQKSKSVTLYTFPLQTPSDVAKMEEILNESLSNHLIIKIRLWQCNCKELSNTVTSMLRIIFSDECAQQYTFDGNNNSKNAFNKLTICSIIIDTALSFHKDKTENDITLQMRKWLSLASIRIKNEEKSRKIIGNRFFQKA